MWGLQHLVAVDTMQVAMEMGDQDDQHTMTNTSGTSVVKSQSMSTVYWLT